MIEKIMFYFTGGVAIIIFIYFIKKSFEEKGCQKCRQDKCCDKL